VNIPAAVANAKAAGLVFFRRRDETRRNGANLSFEGGSSSPPGDDEAWSSQHRASSVVIVGGTFEGMVEVFPTTLFAVIRETGANDSVPMADNTTAIEADVMMPFMLD